MKKLLCVLIAALILLLGACSSAPKGINPGTIYKTTSTEGIPTRLYLRENGRFSLDCFYSVERYITGTYEIGADAVKLTAGDGAVYVFKIDGDSLVFDAANSDEIPRTDDEKPQIADGEKFEFFREMKTTATNS